MRGATAPELVAVLEDAQRLGFLGPRPIPEVIEHARGFVRALAHGTDIRSIVDLGSGGGVPGLVIAHDLPAIEVTLLDRRSKRTDALERYVRRLGWTDRVRVVCADVANFGPDASFDAVVARGFGPPSFTLTAAARLVRPGHPIVISEPPVSDLVARWDDDLLEHLGLRLVPQATLDPDGDTGDRSGDPSDDNGERDATTAIDTDSGHLDGLVAVFVRD